MCACDVSFVCAKCRPRHQADLALSCGVDEPETPAESAYDRVNEQLVDGVRVWSSNG